MIDFCLRRGPVVTLVVAGVLLAGSGCSTGGPDYPEGQATTTTLAVQDTHVALHLDVPASYQLKEQQVAADGCPGLRYGLSDGDDLVVTFEAYARTCAAQPSSMLGNGQHGRYRSLDDVPADRLEGAVRLTTELGSAVVFSQHYFECTNSCHDWTEPVAVLSLSTPADAAYPTLVVRSDHAAWKQDSLVVFVRERLHG